MVTISFGILLSLIFISVISFGAAVSFYLWLKFPKQVLHDILYMVEPQYLKPLHIQTNRIVPIGELSNSFYKKETLEIIKEQMHQELCEFIKPMITETELWHENGKKIIMSVYVCKKDF